MKPKFAILAFLLLAALVLASTCLSAKPQSFTIAWSYDTSGYLETCGCSAHMYGGLARRATKIAQLRGSGPVLAIEGGHIVEDKGEFQLFKGQMVVEALNRMDYGAMMVGVREAQQGPDGLNKLVAAAKFPIFSANLQGVDAPWLKRYAKVKTGGVDVAITGVTQPEATTGLEMPKGVSFSDPAKALADVLPKMAGADLKIICLEGEPSWIDQMATNYKGQANLFLSGDRKEGADLEFHSDPPRMNNFDRGRFLGLVTVDPAPGGFSFAGTNLPLSDDIADAADIKKMLDETYKPQLKDKFFAMFKGSLKLYLPPDYCTDCHKDEVDVYNDSNHALALDTLNAKQQTYNPDCMKCHLTYDAAEDQLHAMNCVTCHSNITDDHVFQALEGKDKVVKPATPVTTYTYEWCVQCHDPLNSTNFKDHWPQYVNAIYHGGDKSAAEAAAKAMGIDMTEAPPPHE